MSIDNIRSLRGLSIPINTGSTPEVPGGRVAWEAAAGQAPLPQSGAQSRAKPAANPPAIADAELAAFLASAPVNSETPFRVTLEGAQLTVETTAFGRTYVAFSGRVELPPGLRLESVGPRALRLTSTDRALFHSSNDSNQIRAG